jgi:hypothetical protein
LFEEFSEKVSLIGKKLDRLAPPANQKVPEAAAPSEAPARRFTLGGGREQAMNERSLISSLPEGFPKPPPPITERYEGSDKEGYKLHMKKKMLRDNWENSLALYKQKELDGDRTGSFCFV